MKKILSIILLYLMFPLVLSANVDYPITIPSVREWTASKGTFNFSQTNRIIISEDSYDELLADAETFNEDISYLFGFELQILKSDKPEKGDLYFSLDGNYQKLGNEGNEIEISDYITIKAATNTGAFYASRTLLQLFRQDNTVQAGNIVDFPDRKERAFQVDNGRKYFSITWLENHIRELSYLKMNYFYFYLSDNHDFRIECETNPEIVSEEHYTKQEIRDLIVFAKKYHITIVPVINFPAHCGGVIVNNREEVGLRAKENKLYHSHIDITLDTARNYISRIIDEYIKLFDSPYWQFGADEYVYYDLDNFPQFLEYAQKKFGEEADALDAFIDFVNWANKIVRSYGKTMRIYNDVMSVVNAHNIKTKLQVDKNIIIDYWEGTGADIPNTFISDGYVICNCAINFLYYNIGNGWIGYNNFIYERFKPNIYNANQEVPESSEQNLGARFHVWCDKPDLETEGHIANEIRNTLRVFSDRLWGGPKLVNTYNQFSKICDKIGLAPYVKYDENPMPNNLCWQKSVSFSSSREDSGYSAKNINDGSYNKQWKSISNSNEWVAINLEKIYELERIRLVWMRNIPDEYQLLVSIDSMTWQKINVEKLKDSRIIDISNISVLAKYIKLDLLNNVNEFTLWEVESYGKEYKQKEPDTDTDSDDNNDSTSANNKKNQVYKVEIAPNPANNFIDIHISGKLGGKLEYKIVDMTGKVLISSLGSDKNIDIINRINIEGLAEGAYCILIKIDKSWISKGFIHIR